MEVNNTVAPSAAPKPSSPYRPVGQGGYRGAPRGAGGQSRGGSRGGSSRPGDSRGGSRGGRRGDSPRREVVKPEYDQKTINVRRVTRVVSGGRRFSFSVAVVIGDKKGQVGVGVGKAGDTGQAIQKAFNAAKKAMIKIPLTDTKSITHQVEAKEASAKVVIRPNFGKGLVAGSSTRIVLELAGITDVTAKVLSPSRNKLNNARAAVKALAKVTKK